MLKTPESNDKKQSSDGDDAMALILQQAGKSADEVAALSTLDDADRSAESQFSGEAPTITSLFGKGKAREFYAGDFSPSAKVAKVMGDCLEFLMKRKKEKTLCDYEKMLFKEDIITGLAERGFFGLAIPEQYGGSGAKLGDLGPLLRALTFVHPDLAVMFEVHNFLGPVTPIIDFGTDEQKDYFLPKMASGELIGSFALTEPGVGADPSKLSMTAKLDGDNYVVSGVKWPITNVLYGGVCVLIVKLEGHDLKAGRDSGMILFEVPKADDKSFAMKRNRLLGCRILMIIAKYQKSFMDQSFLLGDEGGIFDQLCHNLASMCFALSMEKPDPEYLKVAAALDLEASLRLSGQESSPWLQKVWAEIGQLMMDRDSTLHKDLIADIEVQPIPLDPRFIDRFI